MASEIIQQFIRSLKMAEKHHDAEPLVALFSDVAELANLATPHPLRGRVGAYRFWRDYLAAFQQVESHFTRILEFNDVAVLEWVSDGRLPSGRPVHYAGTTILDIDQGRISRLRTYYDSAVFLESGAKHEGVRDEGTPDENKSAA